MANSTLPRPFPLNASIAKETYDAAVVGTGPVGLAAALALARSGLAIALIGPAPRVAPSRADARTAALFPASVALLEALGVWPRLAPLAAPLEAIRIVDATRYLLKAPETLLSAAEIGLEAFAWNIANAPLASALYARACIRESGIAIFATTLDRLDLAESHALLTLATGQRIETRLAVGADGQGSLCRMAAGIMTKTWSYDQSAIVLGFDHGRSHQNVSTEIHRNAGPFTTVPLPGNRSSLVWAERPAEAERLMALADAELRGEIEHRLEGLLGTVGPIGRRGMFAMKGLSADTFAARRVALVGEAAHAFPPIGAQGLNLGFRDAAALADVVGDAARAGEDSGSPRVLERYEASRRADVRLRTAAVDALNRSLIEGLLPFQLARGAGLHLINAIGPLRRAVMRQGLGAPAGLPRLMRELPNARA